MFLGENGNQSKAVYIGILLFLYIIIGVVPIQSAILRTDNPTSKSYTYVVALVGGGNNPQPGEIQRYMNKISGPLLDRIDIHCEIQAVPLALLSQMQPGKPSSAIREHIIRARNIQTERFSSLPMGEGGGRGRIHCNAQMTERMLHQFAEPDANKLPIGDNWQDNWGYMVFDCSVEKLIFGDIEGRPGDYI